MARATRHLYFAPPAPVGPVPHPKIARAGAFLGGALIGLLAAGAGAAAPDRPNVVLILADDVGREVLGCYGGVDVPTPRIDRLAAEGARFRHAYAMPMCHPTRLALLTGQYPFRLGDPAWATFPQGAENRTIAHLFKRAGYATAIAGKWQLAMLQDDPGHPHSLGFDHYALFGHHEGPEYFQPRIWEDGRLRTDVADRYGPDVYCETVVRFIREHRAQPFFVMYSMALCHAVTNDLPQPPPVGPNGRYQTYDEMTAAMDERVGRVLDALAEFGLAENTIVVYLSDNGSPARSIVDAEQDRFVYEMVVSHLSGGQTVLGGKGQFTDAGIRIPLIVRWPARMAKPRIIDDLVDCSDLWPTLAELAGLDTSPFPHPRDGVSFARCLIGSEPGARRWIYASHEGHWALRERRWKLHSDGRFVDAEGDPNEKSPLTVAQLPPPAAAAYGELRQAERELGLAARGP